MRFGQVVKRHTLEYIVAFAAQLGESRQIRGNSQIAGQLLSGRQDPDRRLKDSGKPTGAGQARTVGEYVSKAT